MFSGTRGRVIAAAAAVAAVAIAGGSYGIVAYPGVVVERVVAIGNGQYEVRCIEVNWPRQIFVNQDFQITGADD